MPSGRLRIAVIATAVAIALLFSIRSPGQGRRDKAQRFEIVETTIEQVHAAYKSGKLTAHQLVQGYLDRIRAYDQQGPKLNAIISLNPNALEEADRLDAQYKSAGLVGPL